MGRYGMLQCAANFSNGYGGKNCKRCQVIDDEQHRINHCPEWKNINLVDTNECIDFSLIYDDDDDISMRVVKQVIAMWDLGNNVNCMRSVDPN